MARRSWPQSLVLALGVLHCTEQPDSPYDPAMYPSVVVPLYDAGFTTDDCFEGEEQLDIPERADCSDVKFPCTSSSCGALAEAIVGWVGERCDQLPRGGFTVAVREGCITSTHGVPESSCVREQLLGTRWSCGPETGLAFVRSYPEP
jgi:hypothetical protein